MNFSNEDLAKGILRDRAKVGASLADIDPMNIDRTVWIDFLCTTKLFYSHMETK